MIRRPHRGISGEGKLIKLLSAVLYKFKMMFADKLFFAAMIAIPVMISFSSGYALRYEKQNIIPVAVADEDCSEYSRLMLDRLSRKEGIGLHAADRKRALNMLDNNKVEQVFIIKRGFGEAVKKGEGSGLIELFSAPSSYSAGFIREIVAAEATRLIMSNKAANDVLAQYRKFNIRKDDAFYDEVVSYAESLWEPKPLMTVSYRELNADTAAKKENAALSSDADAEKENMPLPSAAASSAGLAIAFIMFYILPGSSWLIEERVNDTVKRLAAVKGAMAASYWGGSLALFLAGMLQIFVFSTIQKVFFDVALFSGLFSYILIALYLCAVIAVSMFISSVLKTQAQLQAGAPVLAMAAGFMGGCFWNFVKMPETVARLALLTPQGWVLRGVNSLLVNPGDAGPVLLPMAVLFCTALILLPCGYIIINMQLKR